MKQGYPLNPLLFGLYLDALEGRLDDRECDALALVDVHIWLLLFANDFALASDSKVGLQQQLNTFQQLCVERGPIVNVEKTKVMVFNSIDPSQNFYLKVTVLNVCKPSNTWGSCSRPPQIWIV